MQKFSSIKSTVMPLPINDIDTDMIIPAQYLTSVSREGYGKNLFCRLAEADANFPLNSPLYAEAKILAAGNNFGCGSSREHAVWAILSRGFRVVISASFADIFSSNAAKNGLVLLQVEPAVADKILSAAAEGEYLIEVNLNEQKIFLPDGETVSFPFDPFRKHCILNGLDDLDYLLSNKNAIDNFFKLNEKKRFFSTLKANN